MAWGPPCPSSAPRVPRRGPRGPSGAWPRITRRAWLRPSAGPARGEAKGVATFMRAPGPTVTATAPCGAATGGTVAKPRGGGVRVGGATPCTSSGGEGRMEPSVARVPGTASTPRAASTPPLAAGPALPTRTSCRPLRPAVRGPPSMGARATAVTPMGPIGLPRRVAADGRAGVTARLKVARPSGHAGRGAPTAPPTLGGRATPIKERIISVIVRVRRGSNVIGLVISKAIGRASPPMIIKGRASTSPRGGPEVIRVGPNRLTLKRGPLARVPGQVGAVTGPTGVALPGRAGVAKGRVPALLVLIRRLAVPLTAVARAPSIVPPRAPTCGASSVPIRGVAVPTSLTKVETGGPEPSVVAKA